MPVGWETHSSPEMGAGPQDIINQQVLHSCDLLVGIFWTKAGTPTTEFASGTIEEIERHIEAGRLAMLYFSSTPAAMDDVDYQQYQTLKSFKASCRGRGLYESFDGLAEFRNKFSRQLQQKLNAHEMFKLAQVEVSNTLPASGVASLSTPSLTLEARTLLKEVSQDRHGRLVHVRFLGGSVMQSNGKSFCENADRREVAKWEAALSQLQEENLIIARGQKGEFFEITAKGYTVADTINF